MSKISKIQTFDDLLLHFDPSGNRQMASTLFKSECDNIISEASLDAETKSVLSQLCQVQRETFAKYESALQRMLID